MSAGVSVGYLTEARRRAGSPLGLWLCRDGRGATEQERDEDAGQTAYGDSVAEPFGASAGRGDGGNGADAGLGSDCLPVRAGYRLFDPQGQGRG